MMLVLARRGFLARAAATVAGLLYSPRAAFARGSHPTPRPGITAARILTREHLSGNDKVVELFDQVREIPQVVDGIRCMCGCADQEGFYSLLSCYEGDGMARACPICQGEGRMTARLFKEGKSLDEIRAAIDARYG